MKGSEFSNYTQTEGLSKRYSPPFCIKKNDQVVLLTLKNSKQVNSYLLKLLLQSFQKCPGNQNFIPLIVYTNTDI